MLKTLEHARLDLSDEAELRKLVGVDLLILDDSAIDVVDAVESRNLYDLLLVDRHEPLSTPSSMMERQACVILTDWRDGTDEGREP